MNRLGRLGDPARGLALIVASVFAASPVAAATFTVTNTADSGIGSLRQAILDANANPGLDTIAFAIPGAGVHTITPATNYATILEAVFIDGYTQPGASVNTDPVGTNAVLLVELDGSAMAGGGLGFNISSPAPTTVRGLVMNRWGGLAVQTAGGVGTVITGNFLGTDPAGTTALPNGTAIGPAGSGSTIGGATPAERNLISGNSHGIYVQEQGTVIRGNLIGTDATGMLPLGNTQSGIFCANFGGAGTTIGGSGAGEGNVISANLLGIALSQGLTVNTVRGNKIGVNAAGTGPLGNLFWGIATTTGGVDNVIGGIGPGEPNEIAYNGAEGVRIDGGGVDDSIRGNSIHDNGGLGIGLGAAGPHFNDPQDADDGPNHAQNFPIIRQVEHLGPQGNGSTRVVAKFNSTASTTFELDFYSNPACPDFPREFAEGEVYLGSSQATTDSNGDFPIDVTLPVQTEAGARISVTATDPNGNTSEFSQRILFSIFPASGPSAGGLPIDAHGTDFADPTTLTFGGVAATVTFLNDHQLSTSSPALAPGTVHNVVATTPDGTVGTLVNGWVADFLDVPGGHLFYSFVTTLVSNGITVGVGGGNYGVDLGTKRQQMAVFLLKAKNGLCYVPPACTGVFPDVPCSLTFAPWIEALAAAGITTGCGGGNFCPDNLVTRRQMAVFLLKTKYGSTFVPPACTGIFDDVACPGAPAVEFIERLAAEQITGGCSASPPLYCPDGTSTRGQMAVFIVKTFALQ